MAKKKSLDPKPSDWTDDRRAAASVRLIQNQEKVRGAYRVKAAERREEREAFQKFAETSLTIRPKNGELTLLSLNPVQKQLHKRVERQREKTGRVRMLVLKARQPGISTYVEGRLFWRTVTGTGL